MIVDLDKFIARQRPYWDELDTMLTHIEDEPSWSLDLDQAKRLHYLYERASASLASINTFSADPALGQFLERLVARAYGVVHSAGRKRRRFSPLKWFFGTFPRTFRLHFGAFKLSLAVTLAGMLFGGLAIGLDSDAKRVIIPVLLMGDPSERVEQEEASTEAKGGRGSFASMLMTHNTRVSAFVMALGLTWGVGTIVVLFYNGVILGGVIVDYCLAGEGVFLTGWLLPHGSIEIPAILIAGQAGLVLASALIGRGRRHPVKDRLRKVLPAVATLILGVAVMLVWAGIVESVFSQYHKGVLPYWLKIAFGCAELGLLAAFLGLAGRKGGDVADAERT